MLTVRNCLVVAGLALCSGCAISPADLSSRVPNQSFSVATAAPEKLAPKIVSVVERTYPFRHYSTSVVPSGDGITIRSRDQVRAGYVLWIELTPAASATSVRIFIPSDMYWDATAIAGKLRTDIEGLTR